MRYRHRRRAAAARASVGGNPKFFEESDARANLADISDTLASLQHRIDRLHARMQPGNMIPPPLPPKPQPSSTKVRNDPRVSTARPGTDS